MLCTLEMLCVVIELLIPMVLHVQAYGADRKDVVVTLP